mgnify:CR=1 FL=1
MSDLAAASAKRDLRIDFMRGLALVMIYVNHTRGNHFELFTSRNFGFSDAADLFVLLAGMAAALAYHRGFTEGPARATALKIWRRTGKLYVAHATTTVITIGLFFAAALAWNDPSLTTEINLRRVMADPQRALIGIATLGHQLGYFNILPMYMAILAALPAMLLAMRGNVRVMLAGSLALWLLAGTAGLNVPSYPNPGFWFFNPLSWQLLFCLGFAWIVLSRDGFRLPRSRLLTGLAVVYLIVSALWVQLDFWRFVPAHQLDGTIWGFDKTYLAWPRVLHLLALAYVFAMSPLPAYLLRLASTNPLVLMGRHGLAIYCAGSVLSMAGLILLKELGSTIVLDGTVLVTGFLIQWAIARFLEPAHAPAPSHAKQPSHGAPPSALRARAFPRERGEG